MRTYQEKERLVRLLKFSERGWGGFVVYDSVYCMHRELETSTANVLNKLAQAEVKMATMQAGKQQIVTML